MENEIEQQAIANSTEENEGIYLPNLDLKIELVSNNNQVSKPELIIKFINKKLWTKQYENVDDFQKGLSDLKIALPLVENKEGLTDFLYDNGFRTEEISFAKSIFDNKTDFLLMLSPAITHALGSFLLMTTKSNDSEDDYGDGIWSKDFANGNIGISARTMGALLPLVNSIINKYVEDNKHAWERSSYNKIKTALAGSDLVAMSGTLFETYAFNRGRLPEADIYDLKGPFKSIENFQTVFLNRFSGPFAIEQIARTIGDCSKVAHHALGYITEETSKKIESVTNSIRSVATLAAFKNVEAGVWDNSFGDVGKVKNTCGIELASAGATIDIIKDASSCIINKCKQRDINIENHGSNTNNENLTSTIETRNINEPMLAPVEVHMPDDAAAPSNTF